MKNRAITGLLLLILGIGGLSACGTKGPLYREGTEPAKKKQAASDAPAPAAAQPAATPPDAPHKDGGS